MPNSTVRGSSRPYIDLVACRLARQVDRLGRGTLHPEGQLVARDPRDSSVSAGSRSCSFIDRSRSSVPRCSPDRNARGRLQVDDRHRPGAEERPLVVSRQEARPPARRRPSGVPSG